MVYGPCFCNDSIHSVSVLKSTLVQRLNAPKYDEIRSSD